MRRPKRVSFGEMRYPAQKSEAAADEQDDMPDFTFAWPFARWYLSEAFGNLIDLKTGFAEKKKSHKLPLQTKEEAHAHLRKMWILDLALQKATTLLSHPYRREKSVAEKIKESNTEQIAVEKEIEAGLTEKDFPPFSYDDPDWAKHLDKRLRLSLSPYPGQLKKSIDKLSQDIEIAAEIEASLLKEIPKNHPEVTAEVKRIKVLIKADPNLKNWNEFLDKVFGTN